MLVLWRNLINNLHRVAKLRAALIKKHSYLLNSDKFLVSVITLIVLVVYFSSFFHGLIFLDDDTLILTKFSGMGIGEKISSSFTSNYLDMHYYRPIALLSIIFDELISGQSYFIYHLSNLIIHLFTSILIFLILRNIGVSKIISLFSTLFFALSPIQINAVGWIAGRGDLLAAFFSASAFYIFIKFIKNDRTYLLIFITPLLFLAFLSKEVSLLVPFLFLIYYFTHKKNYNLNKGSISVLLLLILVLGSYYLLRGLILTTVHLDKFSFTTYSKNILVLPETVSKFFIPAGIKALAGIDSFTSIAGTILLILLIILPLLIRSVNKVRYYFGLLWFTLLLLPGMVIRTMGQDGFYYWDCRSYLPAIGLTLTISEILKVLVTKKRPGFSYSFVIIYLMILGTVTFSKIKLYESPKTYWNSVKSDYPTSFLPYVGLFNYYSYTEEYDKAEGQLLLAIAIRPDELNLKSRLVKLYEEQKSYAKALSFLKKTLINDKIFSDYLAERFIKLSNKLTLNTDHNFQELINTYRDKPSISKRITKLIKSLTKSENQKS